MVKESTLADEPKTEVEGYQPRGPNVLKFNITFYAPNPNPLGPKFVKVSRKVSSTLKLVENRVADLKREFPNYTKMSLKVDNL